MRVVKFLVSLLVGLIAAGANWWVLNLKLKPDLPDFVRFSRPVKEGELLKEEVFELVELEVPDSSSLLPYKDRAFLYGLPAPRAFVKGDLLLRRDLSVGMSLPLEAGEVALNVGLDRVAFEPALLRVGAMLGFALLPPPAPELPPAIPAPGFSDPALVGAVPPMPVSTDPMAIPTPLPADILAPAPAPTRTPSQATPQLGLLGPFRLVSVGRRLSEGTVDPDVRGRQVNKVITVAVRLKEDGTLDERSQQLIMASTSERIATILLYPSAPGTTGTSGTDPSKAASPSPGPVPGAWPGADSGSGSPPSDPSSGAWPAAGQ